MVLAACSQTGRYSPQPSTRWLGVGGRVCVCERVGRCAPPGWKCPKISQQQPSHLHNAAFFFFSWRRFSFSPLPCLHLSSLALLAVYFFSPPYLSIVRCSCEHQQQTVTLARSLLSLETPRYSFAPACSGFPVSERFDSYSVVLMSIAASHRGRGRATTTSFVKCHKTKGGIR